MSEVQDPNLEDLPEDAFTPPENGEMNVNQLEFAIRSKREQAMRDEGTLVPPGPDEEEPVEEEAYQEVAAEESEEESPPGEEEPPPDDEEEPVEPEAVADDEFWAGRYRTREAAEEAMAEKDRTIDRLFKELHETKGEPQQPQEPQQLDYAAWNEWAAESVANGRGRDGALEALQHGGKEAYDLYVGYWLSDPDQAPAAHAFNNEVIRLMAGQQAMAAVSPLAAQMQQNARLTEAEEAKAMATQRYPDFSDLSEEMDRIASMEDQTLPQDTKAFLAQLAETGLGGKVRAWEYLYMAAKSATSASVTRAQRVEAKRRREASDRAKIAATVSSSEGAQVRTPLSEAELRVLRKRNAVRERLGQPLLPEE